MNWVIVSTLVAGVMAVTMIFIRAKAARRPTSIKRLILPPLFMSTGALMFVFPMFHVSIYQLIESVGMGVFSSIFLIRTSNFKIHESDIYLVPSKAFIVIISSLLVIRIAVKLVIGQVIAFGELSGMFYLLALGMIVSWRLAMVFKFMKIKRSLE